ncbi:low specificity L-threonine aldolase [Pelistega sp. NLN82]|uniref:L-threonine aldolase n=1 Tax=Pelistega ratti TaxID=2652177 RepID=A0A6L9Y7D9_9BURK|nr:low specificity L-threonine aldolase [Pelistega ratti]NEN76233.1 low specificity L-threonine aldolase [Pelistega ratti]
MKEQQFASDNYAGVCPEAWQAMQEANQGSAMAYGDDEWTELASNGFRTLFGIDCEVFFVFNGTAANSLALASLCQSYHSVICSSTAHIETDECGAPEFFSNGSKLLIAPSHEGKLTPDAIRTLVLSRTDIHFPKPRVVTITQPTETGLVYTADEIKAISDVCKTYHLKLHMDGARFAHACEFLQCDPADITWKVGVDVLCFGGTKNGMAVGEAVLFFDKHLAEDFDYRCKQSGQLASKMRFLSAPWVGMLKNDAWLTNARRANESARYLAEQIKDIPNVELMFPVQANGVFLKAPEKVLDGLRERGWRFYTFIGGGARFMFAWDAQRSRIDTLVQDIKECSTLI